MTPDELRSSIFNRLQICELAEQSTIDDPKDPDKVQQRAANVQMQIRNAARELRELLGMPAGEQP
jgi:hypothetical protein